MEAGGATEDLSAWVRQSRRGMVINDGVYAT